MPFIICSVAAVVGIGIFFYGFNRMHRYRMIQDTPTSKVRSIAMGLVEIYARAVPERCMQTAYSSIDCVYYKYVIKEYRRHGSGKHTSYRWDRLESDEMLIPFFAADETGQVYVDPTGAEFNLRVKKLYLQKAGLGSLLSLILPGRRTEDSELIELDPEESGFFRMYSVGDRKYFEYFIEPDEQMYVLGTAANSPSAPDNVLIRKGQNRPTFIISDRSEKELIGKLRAQMLGSFAVGGGAIVVAVIFFLKAL
ncbi:MAG: hypothetical protein HQ592_00530 [Planctomycetes bacterium]|nr:hypothetical protein [Planctomycetota bacterium]